MRESQSISDIYPALISFHTEIEPISKDGKNPDLNYRFLSLDQLITVTKPVLAKNGLAIIQFIHNEGVTTRLIHSSGQWIETTSQIKIEQMKGLSFAQSVGVSLTYCRRYAISSLLNLASEEHTDAVPLKQSVYEDANRKDFKKKYVNDKSKDNDTHRS